MFGHIQSQENTDTNSSNRESNTRNIMAAAYQASQVGTAANATAAAYGYQMAGTPGTYSVLDTRSVNNLTSETTGYVNANQMYQNQAMSSNAYSGLYNSGQIQFSGSQQSNSMTAYQRNEMAFQESSIGYQRNSLGYQGNLMGYQANPMGYPTSYNQPAGIAHPLVYEYQNANYYDTTMHTPNQQPISGFPKQSKWHKKGMQKKALSKSCEVHYCDVCKISCTSSNTYREHLEGQQHKKKAIWLENGILENSNNQGKKRMQCKLCSVSCTGNDAYNAHIRGAKHQKAILLHTKLGKEIPTEETVLDNVAKCSDEKDGIHDVLEVDVQVVGQEYIEEITNEMGIIVHFKCKLCDCQFNDKNAQNIHMKGRRHRLQYKKKVDPNLLVDTKLSFRQRKLHDKILKQASRSWYPSPQEEFSSQDLQVLISERHNSRDDRYIMKKHFEIYPKEDEIQLILRVVLDTEKALKFVSDELLELKPKNDNGEMVSDQNDKTQNFGSIIQGVWRVKHLAKSLLLHAEKSIELVIMCSERPTFTLLRKIVDLLPEAFKKVTTQHTYSVLINTTEAGFIVSENNITVLVQLTNPNIMVKEECANVESNLASEKCSQALTSFKQTQWFLNAVTHLPYCSEIILVLRDLCEKVPVLMPLNCWIVELLVARVISSLPLTMNLSPGDVFRRVMESIASGILLIGGPGLIDPCENEGAPNAIEYLSVQQRDDITAFAQNALRLIAFKKIHEVLLTNPLPEQNNKYEKRDSQKRRSCEEEENSNEKKIKFTSDGVSITLEVTQ